MMSSPVEFANAGNPTQFGSYGKTMTAPASQTQPAPEVSRLQTRVMRLEEALRMMEEQRQILLRRRRRRLIIVGASLSLICHCCLMVYLSLVSHGGGGGGGEGVAVAYEMAILNDSELSSLEEAGFDDLEGGLSDLEELSPDAPPSLEAVSPAIGVASATSSAIPGLGASGDGSGGISGSGDGGGGGGGLGLGGGGGGTTSFFGITAKGTRFAYIVDISGSMGQSRKIDAAMRELAKSIDGLPDYAHFFVLLFSNGFIEPPNQKGWTRAKKAAVRQLMNWLNECDPGGGTQPRSSFMYVFSLEVRPDVIYFLTDGQFQDIAPEEIAQLNSQGKKCVINTIQFGDPQGEDVLRQIAKKSGGLYRFVPVDGI